MSGSHLKLQIYGNVATVTLNRPEKRNALSRELLSELSEALFDLHQEKRVGAVIWVRSFLRLRRTRSLLPTGGETPSSWSI